MIRLMFLLLALCAGVSGWNLARGQDPGAGMSRGAIKAGPIYMGLIQDAAECFRRRDFGAAEARLDEADKIKPGLPDSFNLRGSILVEKREFDQARQMFEQAIKLQPNNPLPKFNAAEILLMQKKFPEARMEFRKLEVEGVMKELVDFKIMVSYLGEGRDDRARETLERIKFPGDTGAYYFAHAAWEFAHGSPAKGKEWLQSADIIFKSGKTYVFYDTLSDMGWIEPRKPDIRQGQ
jgi:Tfp pilus assembly protein PilF